MCVGAIPTIIKNVLEAALGLGRCWKHLEIHVRKSLDKYELTTTANTDVKGDDSEVSDGNEEHIIRNY